MRFKRLLIAVVCVILSLGMFACKKDGIKVYSSKIKSLKDMGLITGDDSPNKTGENWNVGGTDLGIPIYDEANQKMFLAFGDTYSGADQLGNWRSNVMAVTTDLDASDGITIDSFLNNNRPVAKEFIPSRKVDNLEITTIPTGGIVIGDSIYVHYMSVRVWKGSGEWDINYNGVVKSVDGGETWTRVNNLTWAESNEDYVQTVTGMDGVELNKRIAPNLLQVFPIKSADGYIYIYGIPGGRSGGAKLGRVLVDNYEDFFEYEYFNGYDKNKDPIFIKGTAGLEAILENDSSYIVPPTVAEISVMYNGYLKKWMILYKTNSVGRLIFRISDNPWGAWSDEELITTAKDLPGGFYGEFMHEAYSEKNGKIIYIIISQWKPIYNSRLMRLEFK
ncbi:MAG: DUF4185 domain-containing protein [Acholeplasmataceae bacterium]|nr:DUF4185 domain-containing protein [Acholeplasmataceae bacterium]